MAIKEFLQDTLGITERDLLAPPPKREPPGSTVSLVTPQPCALGVSPHAHVTATFSKDMNPATITINTFTLVEQDTLTPVVGTIEHDPPTNGVTFKPSAALTNGTATRLQLPPLFRTRGVTRCLRPLLGNSRWPHSASQGAS
jgi:hypothetical protein